jgi:hypothetical protein
MAGDRPRADLSEPRSPRRMLVACALLAFALAGCKRTESAGSSAADTPPVAAQAPFRVTSVQLGNMIDNDQRVEAPTTEFAPDDTIYASVSSDGSAPEVAMVARWSYEDGQIVSETRKVIAARGSAATEFHIAKASGWPAGRYKVEIIANGKPAGSREFQVK